MPIPYLLSATAGREMEDESMLAFYKTQICFDSSANTKWCIWCAEHDISDALLASISLETPLSMCPDRIYRRTWRANCCIPDFFTCERSILRGGQSRFEM